MAILGKIIKEAHLIDVEIPNSHNLHSTVTEKLRKYTDWKEDFTRIWQLKMVYIISSVLSTTGNIPNKLHGSLKLLNLLKPTGHVMHQQFNIQQLYALPTLYLCVLYLSENKQRLVPLTA